MPVYEVTYVECDECGYGGSKYVEADSRERADHRAAAIRNARSEGFSVTDRGVFCGPNGRCRFDARWAARRAQR